jgi:hypothetical protein
VVSSAAIARMASSIGVVINRRPIRRRFVLFARGRVNGLAGQPSGFVAFGAPPWFSGSVQAGGEPPSSRSETLARCERTMTGTGDVAMVRSQSDEATFRAATLRKGKSTSSGVGDESTGARRLMLVGRGACLRWAVIVGVRSAAARAIAGGGLWGL